MRHLVDGPRQSGRTHRFVEELPEDASIIYLVSCTTWHAQAIKKRAEDMRGYEFSKKIRPVGLDSLSNLRGVDPINIFFEHTAYEQSTAKELREIEMIEAKQRDLWKGNSE